MPRIIEASKKMAKILSAVEGALDDIEKLENMPVMMQAEKEEKEQETIYTADDYEKYLDEQLDKELAEEGNKPFDPSILENVETASEEEFGIEDTVRDTANGGEASTSESEEVEGFGEDAEGEAVAPKEVVAAVAALVNRFDVAANRYQKAGNIRMAYRIDQCSNRISKMFNLQ